MMSLMILPVAMRLLVGMLAWSAALVSMEVGATTMVDALMLGYVLVLMMRLGETLLLALLLPVIPLEVLACSCRNLSAIRPPASSCCKR